MDGVARAERIFPWLVDVRRTLHRHPELAFEEVRTAEVLCAELDRLGIGYRYGGKGTGIIARVSSGEDDSVPGLTMAKAVPGGPCARSRGRGRSLVSFSTIHIAVLPGARQPRTRRLVCVSAGMGES